MLAIKVAFINLILVVLWLGGFMVAGYRAPLLLVLGQLVSALAILTFVQWVYEDGK